jgi:adenylate kinase family enzyme
VIDGSFLPAPGEADDARLARADTVLFLDAPRRVCLWRVLVRAVRDRGRRRPDLPEGCEEGVDRALLGWIWRYPRVDRPRVLALLVRLRDRGAEVWILRSRADVERFLVAAQPGSGAT